ncbi:unnamed protein product [Camellia sinensis]
MLTLVFFFFFPGMFGLIVLDHFSCDSVGLVMLAMLVVRLLLPCFKRFQVFIGQGVDVY